jgi:uncharacterized tellurite resistance protein B-like protein
MSSNVDATVPADDVKADKSLFRNNFQIIKEEITALQLATSSARKMAFDDAQFDAI